MYWLEINYIHALFFLNFFIIENFKIIIKKLYNNELKITYGPPERRYVQQAAPT